MNQILVTKKLYITPELKRKKKVYKLNFIISLFLIFLLFSAYIYAEYDRNKNEEISQDILNNMQLATNDETTISETDDTWIIILNSTEDDSAEEELSITTPTIPTAPENNESVALSGTYKAPNGKIYNIVGTINIPKINVNYPILSETSDSLLKVSVCKFWGPEPNEKGNFCVVGHNYRNSRFFSKVDELEVNKDIIEITDLSGRTVKYTVYDKYTVDPSDVSCTSQRTNGKVEITIITCTDDSKQRIIIKARAE